MLKLSEFRPSSVLFIDDNPLNLREAQHFCPELQVCELAIIPEMLSLDAFKGKEDVNLTRLKQYQVLERRTADNTANSDNRQFSGKRYPGIH